jgi:hypothetical protein
MRDFNKAAAGFVLAAAGVLSGCAATMPQQEDPRVTRSKEFHACIMDGEKRFIEEIRTNPSVASLVERPGFINAVINMTIQTCFSKVTQIPMEELSKKSPDEIGDLLERYLDQHTLNKLAR